MRWLSATICCTLLFVVGCSTQVATDLWGAKIAVGSTIADPRISEKLATVDSEGVQVAADKHAMSEQFAEMIEATLPQIVEQAVRAALIGAGIGAVGSVVDGISWDEAEEVFEETQ
jgi:hypothetical protein